MPTQSKTQLTAQEKLFRDMSYLIRDRWIPSVTREEVPDAWHTLEHDIEVDEPKVKVTLYLDQSVARVFKGMGHGYQARINRLLSAWVQMHIGRMFEAEDRLHKRMAKDNARREAEEKGAEAP